MELLLLCLPYLLLGFVFSIIFSLQVLFSKHKSLFSAASLPPGTYGWPIIGESLEFVSAGWKGHPQRFIHDRMNKFSRECFKTSILGEPVAVMCRAAGNKFLFSNEGKLVTGWWPDSVKKIFPARSDKKEDVKRMRKLIPQFLKPEALKSYIGIMDTIAQGHFASAWENKEEVAVFPLAKQYTFWLACRLFMSMEDPIRIAKLADRFNMLTSGVMTLPIDLPGTPFNRAIKASDIIRKQLRKIIKQRRIDLAEAVAATPTHDILAHMITTTDGEGCHMNDFDIADKILGLLIGGHDTTSVAITSIVRYLAELPHVYDMVYKEQMEIARSKDPRELLKWDDIQKMKYSWNVACEAMRLMPPLQGTFREAIQDFTYAGFFVPKGWKLYWSVYSTHMDHEYFSDPEKFDPTRFEGDGPAPHTYVPFGGGPRMCPGKEYARLEILVFMHNIVRRFKWEKVLPKEKIIANPMPIPENGLPVRLVPHHL